MFLHPYSPELNPAEKYGGNGKEVLQTDLRSAFVIPLD
jgi:hypothetical protein